MLTLLWLKGIFQVRSGRLFGAMTGVALTVALLVSIGVFIASSTATMTQRAAAAIPVDWQIQLSPGTDTQTVAHAIAQSTAYTAVEKVGYASVDGFNATAGGTTQATSLGKVLGLDTQYSRHFPAELRLLIGSLNGALVAQQTASNLHVSVGDTVTIQRSGLSPVTVRVAGIVDLPGADALLQTVGAPAGSGPQAPPDNVLILPAGQWQQFFDPQATVRPDSVHTQFHVKLARDLPADPATAFVLVQQRANKLQAQLSGNVLIANNLAVRLDSVRKDALYTLVLFLFLGLPGVLLAILLTMAVAATGTERRRHEQALLRTRGASTRHILALATLEAIVVGIGGVVLGLALAAVVTRTFASIQILSSSLALFWALTASIVGLLLAVFAVLYPAWVQLHSMTVVSARATVGHYHRPLWQRAYLDVILLLIALFTFWRTASSGYQVVLAPEGVPETSVAYETFLAPLCLWIGATLLALRLCGSGLLHGRAVLTRLLQPVARRLASVVSASLSRQHLRVTRGMMLIALAFSFATSTAIFNTTYNAQARVDAELTNGADVNVSGSTANALSRVLSALRALPETAAVQPMQHRFAYVGNDLQDLYGIDPAHIGTVTPMSNAFFSGGDAQATLSALAARPDGVLVSEETVANYQLSLGDQINLRLQRADDHQYHLVPFHFLGVVREFPTAPKDSFLVTNASYVAQQTGSPAAEIVLLRARTSPSTLAAQTRTVVTALPGVKVTDIGLTQRLISSSLTAIDLRGLTNLELTFAILLVTGTTGLILALGLLERKRTFALLTALGAKSHQLGAFLWSEGLLILAAGGLIGILLGFGIAQMLVTILTGVFDPPPEILMIPWVYLALLFVTATVSTLVAILGMQMVACRPVVATIRSL